MSGGANVVSDQRPCLCVIQLAGELLSYRLLTFFRWAIDMRNPLKFIAHLGLGHGAHLRAVREWALVAIVVDDGSRQSLPKNPQVG
jgi:hypothetical protein